MSEERNIEAQDDHADTPLFATPLRAVRNPAGTPELHGEGIVEINEVSWPDTCVDAEPRALSCYGELPLLATFGDFFIFEASWGVSGGQWVAVRVDTVNKQLHKSPNDPTANLDVEVEL